MLGNISHSPCRFHGFVRILTEVQHSWDKPPPNDKLPALEQLLKPLLGLLTQFSHVFIRDSLVLEGSKDRNRKWRRRSWRFCPSFICARLPPSGFPYNLPCKTTQLWLQFLLEGVENDIKIFFKCANFFSTSFIELEDKPILSSKLLNVAFFWITILPPFFHQFCLLILNITK